MFGKPAIGEILHAGQELYDAVDKFAVKVVQNNETVGDLILIRFLRTPNTDVSVDKPHTLIFGFNFVKKVRLIHGRLQ